MKLKVQSAGDAFFVAINMEKRAIRMYERMLDIIKDEDILEVVKNILAEERQHLCTFSAWLDDSDGISENRQLLKLQAENIIFPGGLVELVRKGGAESQAELIKYAAEQEIFAMEHYEEFAKLCEGEAKDAFLAIALEEKEHLDTLLNMKGN
ncbi:MAG TPA: DUF2202 domain-containing protein [Christensenellaceae bacterium]|jgi:rubrerythrin|nr:DUF2202 domain-containing protein [Christensenellaceae bacterium]